MINGNNSVSDGKLSNEKLGAFTRRTNEIIKRMNRGTLCYRDVMQGLQSIVIEDKLDLHLGVINKTHSIVRRKHWVDCENTEIAASLSSYPVILHQKSGKLDLNPYLFNLYLCEGQNNWRNPLLGTVVQEGLKDKKVLNANVLAYLLEHQGLIPQFWEDDKFQGLAFWGTIYKTDNDIHLVPILSFKNGKWSMQFQQTCWHGWGPSFPAVIC